MPAPPEHLERLKIEFSTQVPIEEYSAEEASTLRRYGSWMRALMLREIAPSTDAQSHFVDMCFGKTGATTFFEATWKKHQLDEMYRVATKMDQGIAKNLFSYSTVAKRFRALGEQGHVKALAWLAKEKLGCRPIDPPPLIDIARIYPSRQFYEEVLGSPHVLPGSYGSRQ